MHISGTGDDIVSYEGKPGGYLSASDSHQYWLRKNGLGETAATETKIDTDKRDETEVIHAEQGRDGVSAALVTVKNGGHTWSGADPFNVGLPLGKTSRDIEANTVIWEFLSKHRR